MVAQDRLNTESRRSPTGPPVRREAHVSRHHGKGPRRERGDDLYQEGEMQHGRGRRDHIPLTRSRPIHSHDRQEVPSGQVSAAENFAVAGVMDEEANRGGPECAGWIIFRTGATYSGEADRAECDPEGLERRIVRSARLAPAVAAMPRNLLGNTINSR